MAHFAKLDENNKVLAIHVVNNEVITINGVEYEHIGVDFLTNLHGHTNWKQTSYNKTFRKNYACIGGFYDYLRDAFITEKPYPSWILNEETCIWEAPIPKPENLVYGAWLEDEQKWVSVEEYNAKFSS